MNRVCIFLCTLCISLSYGCSGKDIFRSSNGRLADGRDINEIKRSPLYNEKYIQKAKNNILREEYGEVVLDEENINEEQNIPEYHKELYRKMIDDEIKIVKKNDDNDNDSNSHKLVTAYKKAKKAQDDIELAKVKDELSQARRNLGYTDVKSKNSKNSNTNDDRYTKSSDIKDTYKVYDDEDDQFNDTKYNQTLDHNYEYIEPKKCKSKQCKKNMDTSIFAYQSNKNEFDYDQNAWHDPNHEHNQDAIGYDDQNHMKLKKEKYDIDYQQDDLASYEQEDQILTNNIIEAKTSDDIKYNVSNHKENIKTNPHNVEIKNHINIYSDDMFSDEINISEISDNPAESANDYATSDYYLASDNDINEPAEDNHASDNKLNGKDTTNKKLTSSGDDKSFISIDYEVSDCKKRKSGESNECVIDNTEEIDPYSTLHI